MIMTTLLSCMIKTIFLRIHSFKILAHIHTYTSICIDIWTYIYGCMQKSWTNRFFMYIHAIMHDNKASIDKWSTHILEDGWRGNPENRQTLTFKVDYTDGTSQWQSFWHSDKQETVQLDEYCKNIPCLQHITKTKDQETALIRELALLRIPDKQGIRSPIRPALP